MLKDRARMTAHQDHGAVEILLTEKTEQLDGVRVAERQIKQDEFRAPRFYCFDKSFFFDDAPGVEFKLHQPCYCEIADVGMVIEDHSPARERAVGTALAPGTTTQCKVAHCLSGRTACRRSDNATGELKTALRSSCYCWIWWGPRQADPTGILVSSAIAEPKLTASDVAIGTEPAGTFSG